MSTLDAMGTMGLKTAIAAERREVAAMLDALPPEAWDAPTLCTGWRVREVAAHMSMGFRHSFLRQARELLAARGNLNRMTDRLARRDAAAAAPPELAAFLRDNADHPWTPPVGGLASALGHDVVHGLDIAVALDLDRRVPDDRLRAVLETVGIRSAKFFGADLTGLALHADDLDWSFGTGAPVHGTAQDLLLVCFGRKLPAGRLRGEHDGRFTAG